MKNEHKVSTIASLRSRKGLSRGSVGSENFKLSGSTEIPSIQVERGSET